LPGFVRVAGKADVNRVHRYTRKDNMD
jgi:hypothetical protein